MFNTEQAFQSENGKAQTKRQTRKTYVQKRTRI